MFENIVNAIMIGVIICVFIVCATKCEHKRMEFLHDIQKTQLEYKHNE